MWLSPCFGLAVTVQDERRLGYRDVFGAGTAVGAEAPGLVNLIGEYTDTSLGYVLPVAIPLRTRVEVAPRLDATVRGASADFPEVVEYRLGAEAPRHDWLDYAQGVTRVLARQGHELRGFDFFVGSEVPMGSGLSSSAALEVALLRALREVFSLDLDDLELALAGQEAENDFVGAPDGVLDQVASSLGREDVALFLDTRSLHYEQVQLPNSVELVVLDSAIPCGPAVGDERLRRQEVERAAQLLGVGVLRDAVAADLPRLIRLPDTLRRRARHVITENARVIEAVDALRHGETARLGHLLDLSHASLRDDFQVTVPDLDTLAEIIRGERGILGARSTGGGFGGSIVALALRGTGREAAESAVETYRARTGREGRVLLPVMARVATSH